MTTSELEGGGGRSFASLGISERICSALSHAFPEIIQATAVQERVIPDALFGRDVLAQAKTGSGKTLAYLLPALERHFSLQQGADVGVLIVVPTKELARQVSSVLRQLSLLTHLNVSVEEPKQQVLTSMRELCPAVLVGTPMRLCQILFSEAEGTVPSTTSTASSSLASVHTFIIDEADLVLGMGLGREVQRLRSAVGSFAQNILVSATLDPESIRKEHLVLQKDPSVITIDDSHQDGSALHQFSISIPPSSGDPDENKFLLLLVLLKLELIRGRILVFCRDVYRTFRVKLFLEQFGIPRLCLLSGELPLNSRQHCVEQFNRGIYDVLVTVDRAPSTPPPPSKKNRPEDEDFSLARGVDFKRVDVVINFDIPETPDSYVHRVGRTARAGSFGSAVSFVGESAEEAALLLLIEADQRRRRHLAPSASTCTLIQPFEFDWSQVDGFRYRCGDALRAVTPQVIRRARQAAVKAELLAAEKIRSVLPSRDLQALELLGASGSPGRHDSALFAGRKGLGDASSASRRHLAHIPQYLIPEGLASNSTLTSNAPGPIRRNYNNSALQPGPLAPSRRSLKKVKTKGKRGDSLLEGKFKKKHQRKTGNGKKSRGSKKGGEKKKKSKKSA